MRDPVAAKAVALTCRKRRTRTMPAYAHSGGGRPGERRFGFALACWSTSHPERVVGETLGTRNGFLVIFSKKKNVACSPAGRRLGFPSEAPHR